MTPLLATFLVQTVLAVNLFVLPVVAPLVAADLGVDPSWIGLYSAIVFASAIVSSLAASAPVRRWGAVRTGQICLALCAGAAPLAASGSLALVAAAAIALGLAFGPETPAASHLLVRVTTACNRPLVFSVKQIGTQIGGILAGLVFPWLLARRFDWRDIVLAAGVLAIGAAALVQPLRARYDSDRDPAAPLRFAALGRSLGLVARTRGLRGLAIAGAGYSALQQCLHTFLVVHLVRDLGQSHALAGAALAVAQFGGIVARIGSGVLANRRWSTPALLVALGAAMTLAALGLVAARPAWPPAALFAVCALFGLAATGWQGIYLAEVARLAPPGQSADATGGILAAAYGGLLLGPLLFSAILEAGLSYASGYLAIAMLSLAGTCALAISAIARVSASKPN